MRYDRAQFVASRRLRFEEGRVLSAEEIDHYQRIVVALHETIRTMGEIAR